MRHVAMLRIGPASFRVGSDWRAPVEAIRTLYAGYPAPSDGIADFTVCLFAQRPWRRYFRPSVHLDGDYMVPGAAPLPLPMGLLAAEMGMNVQLALGERRYLLLHASAAERDGRALVMTGASGAGKSTLSALLMARGWRLMGDEFALVDPDSGLVHALPRLISLKNQSIAEMTRRIPEGRFGPLLQGTPKGAIRHLVPDAPAIARMDRPATPALILFPRYGFETALRPVLASETFVRLTQASTNYVVLGERGFGCLTRLARAVPAHAIDYPDTDAAIDLVESLWAGL